MKVLFAIGNDQWSKTAAERYYDKFGETLEYKNVFYFKALVEEVKQNKTYDRIVIHEDLEQFKAKDIEQLDRKLFTYIDTVTDEIQDSEIIYICSDRRTKDDKFVVRLYNLGIYNILIGEDRNINPLCAVIKKPKTKREAKEYLNINAGSINETGIMREDEVDEAQMMNILNYYAKIKNEPEKFVSTFDQISVQYSRPQLKVIASWLPKDVQKAIYAEPKYKFLLGIEEKTSNSTFENIKNISGINKTEHKHSNDFFGVFKKFKKVKDAKDGMAENQSISQPVTLGNSEDDLKRQQELAEQAEREAEAKRQQELAEIAKKEEEERHHKELAEKIRREAEEREQRELAEKARKEAEERAQQELAEKARKEAEEKAQQELAEKARKEAEERAQQELAEKAKKEAEERAKQELAEKARKEAEERAQQELAEKARKESEEKINNMSDSVKEEDIEIIIDDGILNQSKAINNNNEDLERAKKQQELAEKTRKEVEAKKQQELAERARKEAEARTQQELAERARKEAEAKKQQELAEKARREAEAKEQQELEEKARKEAEAKEQQELAEKARKEAEAKEQQELAEKARKEAEAKKQQELEEKAKKEAEAKAQQELAEKARKEAEAKAQQELAEKAKKEAEAKAQQELAEKARKEAEAKAQQELAEKARKEAEAKAQQELAEKAKKEAEVKGQQELKNQVGQVKVIPTPNHNENGYSLEEEKVRAEMSKLAEEQEKIRKAQAELEEEKRKFKEEQNRIATERNQIETVQAPIVNTTYEPAQVMPVGYKKMVVFVGANKAGTTFMVNAVANQLSSQKILTSILDMTRDRGMYYIYNQGDKYFRKIARECMQSLANGEDTYMEMSKYLKVYTTIPGSSADTRRGYRHKSIIDVIKNNANITIVDADFTTPIDYFEQASEIYIVQDMDILKMQETTSFLREMKNRNVDMKKIKVIINKYVKSFLTPKKIVEGISYYKDPEMTFTDSLLGSKVTYTTVPYNLNNYIKYVEALCKETMNFKGYTSDFISVIDEIAKQVYLTDGTPKKKGGLFK